MEIAKVIGIGIVGGILAVAVKKTNPELGMQVSIAAGVIVFCLVLGYLAQAVDFIRSFAEQYGALYQGTLVLLKVIGIAYLCEFGAGAIMRKRTCTKDGFCLFSQSCCWLFQRA